MPDELAAAFKTMKQVSGLAGGEIKGGTSILTEES
jgi:hypothetical protein